MNTAKDRPNVSSDTFQAQMGTVLFDGTYSPGYSLQTINTSWQRPLDGQTLTSEFTVFVYPEGQNPYAGGEVVGEGGTQSQT